MRVFRIERKKYLDTTLKGVGASRSEGFRWNSLNTFMVYTAESRALALLEIFVHLDATEDLPQDRFIVEIDIPDTLLRQELSIDDLPVDLDQKPPTLSTQYIGDDFVHESNAAILKVPSSIIHQEYNYLINPMHPEAHNVRVITSTPLVIDDRMKP